MASKHVKALRDAAYSAEMAKHRASMASIHAAADHMERLERQLRIARKVLRAIEAYRWDEVIQAQEAGEALAAMRQAGRKK